MSKQIKPTSPVNPTSDALSDIRQQHARELDAKNDEIRSLKRKLGSASPNGTEEFLVSENNSPAIPQLRAPMLKKASRESMRSNGSSRLSIGGAKDEDAIMRDQIRGFQHIIEDLRKENSTTQGEMRDLKDERERLLAETEDLRDVRPPASSLRPSRHRLTRVTPSIPQAVKALELTVEESILLEEGKLEAETAGLKPPAQANGGPPSSPSRDAAKLQKQLAETQVALESQARRHEADFERLQKKLIEVDQKNQREVHEVRPHSFLSFLRSPSLTTWLVVFVAPARVADRVQDLPGGRARARDREPQVRGRQDHALKDQDERQSRRPPVGRPHPQDGQLPRTEDLGRARRVRALCW